MQEYVVNRPDGGAMERALRENPGNAAGTVLRLAWQAGLLRDEIQHLTWEQVDFLDGCLVLPDRKVPIGQELSDWLLALRDGRDRSQEAVVLSDRDHKPLTPQSISRLARTALDKQGQTEVRLIDLRHDFILRQLQDHLAVSHAPDIPCVRKQNVYRRLTGDHHIGNHRLKGRIAGKNNPDAALALHLQSPAPFPLKYQLFGSRASRS